MTYAHTRWATKPLRKQAVAAGRAGFSVAELVVVLALLGILASFALPSVARSVEQTRIDRAAFLMAGDLEYAFTLAAREQVPVRITVNSTARQYTLVNRATSTVLHRRDLGNGTQFGLTGLSATGTIDVFPKGFASTAATYTLATPSFTRTVQLTRAGQVRVQ